MSLQNKKTDPKTQMSLWHHSIPLPSHLLMQYYRVFAGSRDLSQWSARKANSCLNLLKTVPVCMLIKACHLRYLYFLYYIFALKLSPYLLGCQVSHAARDVSREPKEVLHDVVVDVLSVASEPLVQLTTLAVL